MYYEENRPQNINFDHIPQPNHKQFKKNLN